MEKLLNFVIFISLCIIGYAFFHAPSKEISYVNSDFPVEPVQTRYLNDDFIAINQKELDLKIYPKAKYQIYAMVMSKHKYSFGWQSRISPYDFALAWDKLMLLEYQKGISYSQSGRWYYYNYKAEYPLQNSYIMSHSSNHHIIPCNDNLKKAADRIKKGDKIYLEGYLVSIKGKLKGRDVWWNSSLSRNDSGDGACELLYLTKAVIGNETFE